MGLAGGVSEMTRYDSIRRVEERMLIEGVCKELDSQVEDGESPERKEDREGLTKTPYIRRTMTMCALKLTTEKRKEGSIVLI